MPETKLTLQTYPLRFGKLGNLFLLSAELRKFDSAFKVFLARPTANNKDTAVAALKTWKDSKASKNVKEVEKATAQGFIQDIEFTLNTIDAQAAVVVKRAPEPPAFDTKGNLRLYRGDSRRPDVIQKDGFDLWPAAKNAVTLGIDKYFEGIFKNYVDTVGTSGSRGWADYARASKDQSRPTISTALDDGCGGYTSGPIYKIQIDGLKQYTMTDEVMGCHVPWKEPLRLYLDGPTVAESSIVAVNLNLRTFEVVMMTFVDPEYVVAYKEGGGLFGPL